MSDADARPSGMFVVDAEYVRLDCPLPGYDGFWIEARLNLRNRERKRLKTSLDEIDRERAALWTKATERGKKIDAAREVAIEAGDVEEANRLTEQRVALIEEHAAGLDDTADRIHDLIAPYVRSWNVMEPGDDGRYVDAPPPMVAGRDAFEAVDQTMLGWMATAIMGAYRGGKGLSGWLPTAGGPAAPISESNGTTPTASETADDSANSPPSPMNSPTPSALALAS